MTPIAVLFFTVGVADLIAGGGAVGQFVECWPSYPERASPQHSWLVLVSEHVGSITRSLR